MRRDEDIGEREQAGQFVIEENFVREIFEKDPFFFLINIQRNSGQKSALQGFD